MPERNHFGRGLNNTLLESENAAGITVGCSSIVERTPKKGLVLARNLDWSSLGRAGTYSLVIQRKYTANNMHNTVEVGFPVLVGTLTGMNNHGLSLAMNVCRGNTTIIQGMPALFYNRLCLEIFKTVKEVQAFEYPPFGPFHLIVADKQTAASFHFYQSPNRKHVIRYLQETDNDQATTTPLTTLNFRYGPSGLTSDDMGNSAGRAEALDQFYKNRGQQPLEQLLVFSPLNNSATIHRVVMKPNTGRMRVGFDNMWAGLAELHEISI